MKLLLDFFPVLVFFIGYYLWNIYIATAMTMAAAILLLAIFWLQHRRFESVQVASVLLIVVLGSLTLLFHNPLFIKWKPTGVYWLTAIACISYLWLTKQTFLEKILAANITIAPRIWHHLNYAWIIFFITMGFINLYVAYYYSTTVWVNFKVFGGLGSTLIFVLLQIWYINKHMDNNFHQNE